MSHYSFSIHFPTVTCFGGGAGAAPRLLTCLPMTLQGTRRGVVAFRSAPASQKPAQNGAERSRGIQPLPPEPEPRSQRLRHHVGPTAPVLDVPDRQQGKATGGGTCPRQRERRRPEKVHVPRPVRPSVLRGCTEDTWSGMGVRRRPSRAFLGRSTGGARGR